ncbi:FAD-dependent monooxygenase [Thermoactinospora rubra]|uniref:FAD-dependent monooxygenase n=1 Tax=Thermoactinospora rubra TaxID=1088767 RepID=UPI000A0F91EE|nr:FAD-dependent monooxygenase [Thermoactinospora rubra]
MDILISGASVAGPALAYWLNRNGHRTTIVERAPALREGGHSVDFRGHAHLGVLRKMGILEEVERNSTRMGAMSYVNSEGRPIARMPADLFAGDIEIQRGDLAKILYNLTKDRTEYVFGDSIASLTQDANGVAVTFERTPTRRFDLVIGADGVHSKVRSLAFGPEERFVTGLGLNCAVFTTRNHLGLEYTGHLYMTPRRLAGLYTTRHNTEAKAMFYFPAVAYDRHDTGQQKKIIAEQYAGGGWILDRLIEDLWEADDLYFDAVCQVRMDSWSNGRVALLGDAAWCASPLSGMGTGLAMVGAYVLAGELGRGVDGAFERYEAAMRDYVRGCQKSGEGVAQWMVPSSKFVAWLLRVNYKLIPYAPWKGLIAKGVRKTAEAITLQDY